MYIALRCDIRVCTIIYLRLTTDLQTIHLPFLAFMSLSGKCDYELPPASVITCLAALDLGVTAHAKSAAWLHWKAKLFKTSCCKSIKRIPHKPIRNLNVFIDRNDIPVGVLFL